MKSLALLPAILILLLSLNSCSTTCGSFYCASPGCCDTVSREVLKRATAQGGTGEPHLGQIPTMEILAP